MMQRLLLGASGGALTVYGLRKKSLGGALLAVVGGGLVARSLFGRDALGLPSELRIERSVLVAREPIAVYRAWRDVERLPHLLRHVVDVRAVDEKRSHWQARVLAGSAIVEWDAELTEDVEGQRLAWRSLGGDVDMNGEARFEPALGFDGTVLHVDLRYRPRNIARRVAAVVFNRAVVEEVKEDLRRFKAEIETGEVPSTSGQPVGAV